MTERSEKDWITLYRNEHNDGLIDVLKSHPRCTSFTVLCLTWTTLVSMLLSYSAIQFVLEFQVSQPGYLDIARTFFIQGLLPLLGFLFISTWFSGAPKYTSEMYTINLSTILLAGFSMILLAALVAISQTILLGVMFYKLIMSTPVDEINIMIATPSIATMSTITVTVKYIKSRVADQMEKVETSTTNKKQELHNEWV